ncbi:M1-specific T cell receptor beta chain-like [Salvelinus namaycush]|uniref:M1-specific T cell receptor beta chain-like n=1 Tax=Salvelinus namaycush TaxID=8040 RepID=UPI001901C808|nr:M1-specific T cell receptor beta chain-like [Salvelinus namaycush]
MFTFLSTVTVSLLCAAGLVEGSEVTQTPTILWELKDRDAQMNCSHTKGGSYFQMYWYRQLPGEGMKQVAFTTPNSKPEYSGDFSEDKFSANKTVAERGSFTVKKMETGDSGMYFCAVSPYSEAYFGAGTKLTVLDPNIKVTEPTVKVLPPSTKECEDRNKKKKKTLVCVATRFYPDHVTVYWQVNNVNTTAGAGTDNKALWDKDSLYSITSRLRVPANDWHNPKNSFTCNVIFFNGTGNTTEKHTISGDLQGQIGGEITTDNYVKSTQTAKLAYSIFIAKSTFYGLVVMVMIWKFQGSSEKHI